MYKVSPLDPVTVSAVGGLCGTLPAVLSERGHILR